MKKKGGVLMFHPSGPEYIGLMCPPYCGSNYK